jgi:hypothetical protein
MSLRWVEKVVVILFVLGLAGNALAEEDKNSWIDDYVRTATTETIKVDNNGRVKEVTTTVDTSVQVRRKVTETMRVDTNGIETVVYRRTDGYNSVGRVAPVSTVIEGLGPDGLTLVVKSVTTVSAIENGRVTTVETRNKSGLLVVTGRTTYQCDENGVRTTTVERPGADGELTVTQTTTSQSD